MEFTNHPMTISCENLSVDGSSVPGAIAALFARMRHLRPLNTKLT